MKYLKTLLAVIGVIALILIALTVFSFLYSAVFYLIVIGVLAAGGYAGYKFLKSDDETKYLSENKPTAVAEMENHERTLEEYKQKYLPK